MKAAMLAIEGFSVKLDFNNRTSTFTLVCSTTNASQCYFKAIVDLLIWNYDLPLGFSDFRYQLNSLITLLGVQFLTQ